LGAKRLKLTQLIQRTLPVGRLRIKSVDTAKLAVNSIIYIVGLVVVIVAVLSFFGLR